MPESWHGKELIAIALVYLVLAAGILIRRWPKLGGLVKDGFKTSYEELNAGEAGAGAGAHS